MQEIKLANARGVALVDDEDYEIARSYPWCLLSARKPYAYRARRLADGEGGSSVYMHRQLLGFPAGMVDHRNGNKLDNQRSNLRIVSVGVNNANLQSARSGSKSGALGVNWLRKNGKWRAEIGHAGQTIHIGLFDDLHAAVLARRDAELRLYGEVVPATSAWLLKRELVLAA